MLRAPMFVACLVLSALTLAGVVSSPVQAVPERTAFLAEPASAGCPYADEGDALALPPGHPPVAGPGHRLPPGHPPIPGHSAHGRGTPPPAPRFDQPITIDL